MLSLPIIHQRVAVGMKIFDRLADVPLGADCITDIVDVTAVEPNQMISANHTLPQEDNSLPRSVHATASASIQSAMEAV